MFRFSRSVRTCLSTASCAILFIGLTGLSGVAAQNTRLDPVHGQTRDQVDDSIDLSPYAGQQHRPIKSLSDEDIAELRKGGGWGLAKAAELNGVPGPVHLLELADDIPVSVEQRSILQRLYKTMKQAAIAEGANLIATEVALDQAFRAGDLSSDMLRVLLDNIEQSRGHLRFIHLSAHLETRDILTAEQIERYNTLRGYGRQGCVDVPAGHDPKMWRRHNPC